MARTIKPADLGTSVFKFGGYYLEANSKNPVTHHSGIGGPIVPKSSSGKYYNAISDKDKHFVQDYDPFSFSLVEEQKLNSEDVPVYNLKLLPASETDTRKIVYLPYYDKNITATTIRPGEKSVCYFMTDKLSGCNMYIDQRTNGELVCYHANAQHSDDAQAAMDKMHNTAKKTGEVNKASLTKAKYYAKVKELEALDVKGQTDRKFSGGTTIMGFRADNGQWEFHFQTYGRITYTIQDTGILSKVTDKVKDKIKGKGKETAVNPKGKGKEVSLKDVPLKIIDYGRFWP